MRTEFTSDSEVLKYTSTIVGNCFQLKPYLKQSSTIDQLVITSSTVLEINFYSTTKKNNFLELLSEQLRNHSDAEGP